MTSTPTPQIAIDDLIMQLDASGAPLRIEYVRGRLKWEASPASRHQYAVDAIRESLRPIPDHPAACGCVSLADTLIRFPDPDRSIKRPDIAIFCEKPPISDEALTVLPAAVVEILSIGYEAKDTGPDGAPFYLSAGVRDVLVVDPRGGAATHYRPGQPAETFALPYTADLSCGCRITIRPV